MGNSIKDGVRGARGLVVGVADDIEENGSFFIEGKVVDGVVEERVTDEMKTT